MGKITNGLNGTISGKVGSVVYCTWKGINYARGMPRFKNKKKPTSGQAKQRSKFSFLQKYLHLLLPILRLGFQHVSPIRTAHNSAMSYNFKHAVLDTETGYEINPEMFKFSMGPRPVAIHPQVIQKGNELHFSWKYNDLLERDYINDQTLLLVIHDSEDFPPLFSIHGAKRHQEADKLSVWKEMVEVGVRVNAYIAFISTDGTSMVSDSSYIGMLELVDPVLAK